MMNETKPCPICGGYMVYGEESYAMEDIFKKWAEGGIVFSQECIQEHMGASCVILYKCTKCQFSIFQPAVVGSPRFYEEYQDKNPIYYTEDKWEFRQACEELCPGERLLEIGCGDGCFLEMASLKGVESIGLEYNNEAVNKALAKGLRVKRQSLEELACMSSSTFDVICAFQVLEHVADPIGFLQNMADCTKQGGKVIIGVPNQDGFIKYAQGALTNIPPHHISRWTDSSLYTAGQRVGLKLMRMAYEPLNQIHYEWLILYWRYLMRKLIKRDFLLLNSFQESGTLAITRIIKLLRWMRISCLPAFPGHTLYAVFRKC